MKRFWVLTVFFDIVVMVCLLGFTTLFSYPWLFDLVWISITTVIMGIILKLEKRFDVFLLFICLLINLLVLFTIATIMLDIGMVFYAYLGFSSQVNFLFLLFANVLAFGWIGCAFSRPNNSKNAKQ